MNSIAAGLLITAADLRRLSVQFKLGAYLLDLRRLLVDAPGELPDRRPEVLLLLRYRGL
jgi:hypothetical protein